MIYDKLKKNLNNIIQIKNKVIIHFVRGPFVEIKGNTDAEYRIEFIDRVTGKVLYTGNIKNNMWSKCNIEYFVNWQIKIIVAVSPALAPPFATKYTMAAVVLPPIMRQLTSLAMLLRLQSLNFFLSSFI